MIRQEGILPLPNGAQRTGPDTANPKQDLRSGMLIASFFFLGFIGWASFARLDAAAYAPGTLVVLGQRQAVQHRDGGVIGRILVHEGQRVQKGQLLIQLAAAEVRAQERSLASQAIRLLAQRARLESEQLDSSRVIMPSAYFGLNGIDRVEALEAVRLQQTELDARLGVLSAQKDTLRERVGQSRSEARGYGDQATSAREQLRLIDEQIIALKPLAEKGFVSQTRMRELERSRAGLEGQRGQYVASVAQTRSVAQENRLQVMQADRTFHERTSSDLREVEAKLGEITPKWVAARDQLSRTEIRAPATGAVIGLTSFSRGGVISPGQRILDIVPEGSPLRIEVRFAPDDADDLLLGQTAMVKFPGLHDRTLPDLTGKITRLSADSVADEKTGQSYFLGEITVPINQMCLVQKLRGNNFIFKAGMPAQVLVPLRRRTALDYAFEPLIGSFWSSFREH